jgi:mRNA interferase RelE/StbE
VCSGAGGGVAEYKVVVARSARRELETLEAAVARRIISRVEALTTNPRPRGCVKLQGAADLWRIRIGDYRDVLFASLSSTRSTTTRARSTSALCDTEATPIGRGDVTSNMPVERPAARIRSPAAAHRRR